MNNLNLNDLELKTFTEQDALDYCLLNNINLDNIIELYLVGNKLTDISGVKLFKNLEKLDLSNNLLQDISVIQYLNKLKILYLNFNSITDISFISNLDNLEELYINNLELDSNQYKYIKSLKKLKYLYCGNGFKDMNITNQFNKNITIIK